ncbi:MAG: DUF1080 domain-containing protein [Verrucomicrobia bacterium]|nr:DUF1080 domain-containing protein [Verrucomicrobiota bacterium]
MNILFLSRQIQKLVAAAAVCGGVIASALAGEPVQLFNGTNLQNWHAYLAKHGVVKREVWSVQDGLLVCKGEPLGYLYTDQQFESFKLVVEWRWAPGKKPGNNGVLMRITGEPRPLPKCIEAQLQSGSAGDLYGFHGLKIDGDAARKIDSQGSAFTGRIQGVRKISGNEKPVGEWNRYEIVLDGPKLTVWINGEKVNEAHDCDVLAGPVGIQSEGGEIHFRKLELTPLR